MPVQPEENRHDPEVIRQKMQQLEKLAKVMDGQFGIPGTKWRLGLDAVIGVVPVVGDLAGAAVSSYLIWQAWTLDAPKPLMWKMARNTLVETVGGIVPIFGDIFDVFWRANQRNVALMRGHLKSLLPPEPEPKPFSQLPIWARLVIAVLVVVGSWLTIDWLIRMMA